MQCRMSEAESAAWRPDIPGWSGDILPYYEEIAKLLPNRAKVVEVGVMAGRSAAFLASRLLTLGKRSVELYCVDTWEWDQFHRFTRTLTHHVDLDEAAMLRPIRFDSAKAARLFDDGSLDLVFIDAGHEYEAVSVDIAAWLPKVRTGGILAGHDYSEPHPGVIQAVDELAQRYRVDRPTWSVWEVRA